MFNIEFYSLPNGEKPVQQFLDSLDNKMRAKALYSLSILSEYGDGLFELRVKFASDITRIFYFFVVDNTIVLTNGFVKKTMKTPQNEVNKARNYKADYERRAMHE